MPITASIRTACTLLLLFCGAAAHADDAMLKAFGAPAEAAPEPWRVNGLPHQTKPFTKFSIVELDGHAAVRIEADKSYGNLVHPLTGAKPPLHLAWQWRVDQLIDADDLRSRGGDDTAVKVCVFFDLALDKVPFIERQLLRSARQNADVPLPAASVCYVWDAHLPVGTALDNAFTRRVRYKVLQSGPGKLKQWAAEKRDVAADFLELFGGESTEVPPITGIAIGADADNTKSHSLAYVAEIVLAP